MRRGLRRISVASGGQFSAHRDAREQGHRRASLPTSLDCAAPAMPAQRDAAGNRMVGTISEVGRVRPE